MAHSLNVHYKEAPEMMNKAIPFSVEESNGRPFSAPNLGTTSAVFNTDTQCASLDSLHLSADKGTTKPPIKVIVKYGNIETQRVDVLSTPLSAKNPSLKHLNVTRSLQLAAGDTFSNLFIYTLNNRTCLEAGRILAIALASGSYFLNCKFVMFIALNNWSYCTISSAEGELRSGIKDLLEQCNVRNVDSIAMSAIGTGMALAFPPQITATIIGEEIKFFVERNPNTTIKELQLVIQQQPRNDMIFIAYRDTLSAMDLGDRIIVCNEEGGLFPRPQFGASIKKNMGNLSVLVVYGNIVEENTNAIVNTTNFKRWTEGSVAHSIFSMTGTDIVREAQHGHNAGSKIVMTGPGNLKCNWVLHCNCNGHLETIRVLTEEILTLCEKTGLRSLSIPAIGTGECRLCPWSVAQTLKKAISDFAKQRKSCPSVVRLIAYNPYIYSVFCMELQKPDHQ